MGLIPITDHHNRKGMLLPLGGTRESPDVIIPWGSKMDLAEVDQLIRSACAKAGLTEKQAELLAETAEKQYEMRVKTREASTELHMRIREQARYPKLKHGGLRPVRKRS